MPGPGLPVVKVVMKGLIGTGQTWSAGVFLHVVTGEDPPTHAFLLEAGSGVNDAVVNYWEDTPRSINNGNCQCTGWAMYAYGSTSTTSVAVNEYEFGGPIGGEGSASLPNLTAMVQSLRTDVSGRSYRGRMYLPATGATLTSDGHFTNAQCTGMALATSKYLTALGTALTPTGGGTGATPVVASFTKSICTEITQVLVDDIPDTQHRREDKLGAAFTGVAAVPYVAPS